MKKLTYYLISFFFAAFSWQGMAQLTEDFETDPPSGWTFQQTETDDPGFVITTSQAHGGNSSFYHNDTNIAAESTSYMVSPAYTVQSGDELAFWYYQKYSDLYYVYSGAWISTASNDPIANPGDFTELIEFGANGSEDTWTQFKLALDSYVGQTVYIAFKYTGNHSNEIYIDDFYIAIPLEYTPVATLAELRAGTIGEKYEFTGTAYVTAAGSSSVFGQDNTAGMRFYAPSLVSSTSIGDGITGIKGVLAQSYDVLKFEIEPDVTFTGTNQPVTPPVLTAQEYIDNREDYESELIQILNTTITVTNGDTSFTQDSNYTISDPTNNLALAVYFPELNGPIPEYANITGIAVEYFGSAVLLPRDDADVEEILCLNVLNISADNFTASGNADLTWDTLTEATGFNWEIQPQGTAQSTTPAIDSGNVSTNAATASSLTGGTTYTLYVQSDCGNGDLGTWMSYNFTFTPPPVNDLIGGAISITPKPEGATCDATTIFTARLAGDGATDSGLNGTCDENNTGIDLFYSWTATAPALLFKGNTGDPGVIIRDSNGNEIDCTNTGIADVVLKGWTIGDELIIQVYDYAGSDDDITFCLSVINDDDGDGIDNATEANDGTDANDPCDPAQAAGYTGYDATNTIWGAADCDGDGQNNAQEFAGGSDPYDANSTVSIEELKAIGFEYYPNPVNSSLTVKANENITSVTIFNMLGQQVKQVNPSNLNAVIDMTSLANGTYFVKATVGEKVGTFKIMKK